MTVRHNSDELSSQTKNLIMVFVLKLILVFCSLLGGFSIYVINVTKSDMKNMVRSEILGTTAVYQNNIADIQLLGRRLVKIEQAYQNNIADMEILKYEIKAGKKDFDGKIMQIVSGEVSTLRNELEGSKKDSDGRVMKIVSGEIATLRNEIVVKKRISKIKKQLEQQIAHLRFDLNTFISNSDVDRFSSNKGGKQNRIYTVPGQQIIPMRK